MDLWCLLDNLLERVTLKTEKFMEDNKKIRMRKGGYWDVNWTEITVGSICGLLW
jgi:hypothetical protein